MQESHLFKRLYHTIHHMHSGSTLDGVVLTACHSAASAEYSGPVSCPATTPSGGNPGRLSCTPGRVVWTTFQGLRFVTDLMHTCMYIYVIL